MTDDRPSRKATEPNLHGYPDVELRSDRKANTTSCLYSVLPPHDHICARPLDVTVADKPSEELSNTASLAPKVDPQSDSACPVDFSSDSVVGRHHYTMWAPALRST